MKKVFTVLILTTILFTTSDLLSQSVGINSSGASPDASSMLDVASTGKGLLLPRMSAAQRDGIGSPATGLLVYVNDDNTFYYYNGTSWVPLFGDNAGWKTLGNASTSAATNFIGTTDAVDLVIRTNNTERMRILSGGNVGIGTAAPTKNVDIVVADDVGNTGLIIQNTDGHIELENGTATANNFAPRLEGESRGSAQSALWLNGQIGSTDDAGTSAVMLFQAQRNTPAAVVTRPLFQWRNNATPEMTMDVNGNLGIGTTSPSYLLDILSTSAANLRIQGAANNDARLRLEGDRDWLLVNDGDGSLGTADYFHIYDNTATASRLTINNSGDIGIGDTSPVVKLKVAGDIETNNMVRATGWLTGTGVGHGSEIGVIGGIGYHLSYDRTASSYEPLRIAGSTIELRHDNSSSDLVVDTSGNIGIATTSPNANLDIRQWTAPFNSIKTHLLTGYSGSTNNRSIAIQQMGNVSTANQFLMLNGGLGSTSVVGTPTFTSSFANSFGIGSFDSYMGLMAAIRGTNSAAIVALAIDSAGRVGIGTTTPSSIFDITTNTNAATTSRVENSSAGTSAVSRTYYFNDVGGFTVGTASSTYSAFPILANRGYVFADVLSNGLSIITSNASGNIKFYTGGNTSGHERVIIDNTGKVGIGTSTPTSELSITGVTSSMHLTGTNINFDRNSASYVSATDASGFLIFRTGGNTSSQDRVRIDASGNVGIGTGTPGGLLELALDQGRKPGTNTWTVTSDARLKNITGDYKKGLAELDQLQPITYKYKNAGEREFRPELLEQEFVGFTAQEVQQVFPEAVGTDDDGYLNLNIQAILVAYLNAIKELKDQNEAQQKLIEQLLNRE